MGLSLFSLYLLALLLNSLWIYSVIARSETTWQSRLSKGLLQALLSIPVIFITHLWYGIRFLQGYLFTEKLTR